MFCSGHTADEKRQLLSFFVERSDVGKIITAAADLN
jgi:hypothetical protein